MEEREPVYMKCGHITTARMYPDGIPICPICMCHETEDQPSVEGRKAHCTQCSNIRPSSFDLPFFWHRPEYDYDLFFDGCTGFD